VLGPDFNLHMDIQQAVNFAIHECFEAEGIEFAYPTQTLYLERSAAREETAG
jgi:small-conductance mechanosensitive channel